MLTGTPQFGVARDVAVCAAVMEVSEPLISVSADQATEAPGMALSADVDG